VVRRLFIKACRELDQNTMAALADALAREESPIGRDVLETLIANANLARERQVACCQDTGTAIVYLQIGQEVSWAGAPLIDCIHEGVRQAYRDGYLRMSMLDPLTRKNTGDNTPAVVHIDIVPGDAVSVTAMPKGGGSENMARLGMLNPADGPQGIVDFVLETVALAGGNPCPPFIVGIGIGGTVDSVTWLAKQSLLRPIGHRNPEPALAALELDILERSNRTGIGPLGMGGRITALDVHIESMPCHITGLPVAVNFQCHANRHATEVL
jgi:fumarate hydratase subunit alpha